MRQTSYYLGKVLFKTCVCFLFDACLNYFFTFIYYKFHEIFLNFYINASNFSYPAPISLHPSLILTRSFFTIAFHINAFLCLKSILIVLITTFSNLYYLQSLLAYNPLLPFNFLLSLHFIFMLYLLFLYWFFLEHFDFLTFQLFPTFCFPKI